MAKTCRLLLVAILSVAGASANAAPATSVFPDPGLTQPRLRFHTGRVVKARPELFPTTPDVPGPVSAWRVLEWRKASVLRPEAMTRDDATAADPALVRPAYAFATPGTRFAIFRRGGSYVYELESEGGVLDASGGSNLFLSAPAVDKAQSFDRSMTYSLLAKISKADIDAPYPEALKHGAVLAQVFSGFSLRFEDPRGSASASLFLQIGLADSRGAQPEYRGCYPHDGRQEIVYTGTLDGDPHLDFRATPTAPLQRVSYDLNRYLCDVVARPFTCRAADGSASQLSLPPAALDFRNWTVREMYVGLETENTDLRPGSANRAPQGHVAAALQLADLRVTRDPTRRFDASMCEKAR